MVVLARELISISLRHTEKTARAAPHFSNKHENMITRNSFYLFKKYFFAEVVAACMCKNLYLIYTVGVKEAYNITDTEKTVILNMKT